MNRITHVNIRATTDQAFWGREYADSLYLWEFSKHHLPLRAFAAADAPTLEDPFPTTRSVREAYAFCREVFLRKLGTLHQRFNQAHGLDYPLAFWRTALGSWLYRHISIVYDKFVCLERLDIDTTDITLLSPRAYYTPRDPFDHLFYFCNDPGVMQLVSQYYALFARRPFPARDFSPMPARPYFGSNNRHASLDVRDQAAPGERDEGTPPGQVKNRLALCCAYYPRPVFEELARRAGDRVAELTLPQVPVAEKPLNAEARALLARPESDDPFELYLSATLERSLPGMLVEHFADHHRVYARHAREASPRALVTECWITFLPLSLYCALARQLTGTRLVLQHHGANNQLQLGDMLWLEQDVADTYLTTGFRDPHPACAVGGFAVRERIPHRFDEAKRDILHVSTTRFPYLSMCGTTGYAGKRFLHYCRRVEEVLDSIPARLKPHFVFRPRRDRLFLNTEFLWDAPGKGVRVEAERDFTALLQDARLVIIDHMSTGLAEIACDRVPFLYLYDDEFERLADEHAHVFDALMACGVVHATPASLVAQLDRVYDDVRGWWESPAVQRALDGFLAANLGDPAKTVDALLALAAEP